MENQAILLPPQPLVKRKKKSSGVDEPGDDRPGLLGVPTPVGAPGGIGPDRAGDDPGGKPGPASMN